MARMPLECWSFGRAIRARSTQFLLRAMNRKLGVGIGDARLDFLRDRQHERRGMKRVGGKHGFELGVSYGAS